MQTVVLTRYFHAVGPRSPATGKPRWVRHDFRTADGQKLVTFKLSVAEAALEVIGHPVVVETDGNIIRAIQS